MPNTVGNKVILLHDIPKAKATIFGNCKISRFLRELLARPRRLEQRTCFKLIKRVRACVRACVSRLAIKNSRAHAILRLPDKEIEARYFSTHLACARASAKQC